MITIKFGGSLAKEKEAVVNLVEELERLVKEYEFVIVPGGGIFADLVREIDDKFGLPPRTSHEMAILGMEQMGLFLSNFSKKFLPIRSLEEIKTCLGNKLVPIFLPMGFLLSEDELEHSWDVTSDTIAAYIANETKSEKLILLKDVDGLFDSDPNRDGNAKLIKRIRVTELARLNLRGVDSRFPQYLARYKLPAYIVNGYHPKRLRSILESKKTLCTEIIPP